MIISIKGVGISTSGIKFAELLTSSLSLRASAFIIQLQETCIFISIETTLISLSIEPTRTSNAFTVKP